jgi:hypothetical protein
MCWLGQDGPVYFSLGQESSGVDKLRQVTSSNMLLHFMPG